MSDARSSIEEKPVPAIIDPRQADAGYKPFPSFMEWSKCTVDTDRWDHYTARLQEQKEASPHHLRRALEIVTRAAAVDTGAIEGLYEVDRGFTFTVATEAAMWQAAVEQKGLKFRALFESQLRAYDYVLDFATQHAPIVESWIRTLHAEICWNQETYTAYTEIGPQELSLPKGEYKHLPNHVVRKDETIHAYAPVDLTPAEMYRLCEELRSEAFLAAHSILQASYAHYALVVIHPFADGNGRVARALASVFTYRSHSIPLLILAENRNDYFASLEAADAGRFQSFVDFILERGLDAIQLAHESLRLATLPSIEDSVAELQRLYVTRGADDRAQVDETGVRFLESLYQELVHQIKEIQLPAEIQIFIQPAQIGIDPNRFIVITYHPAKATSRLPLEGGLTVLFTLISAAPAHAQLMRTFGLEVPKDFDGEDTFAIQILETGELFEARATELIPVVSASLQMRISIWIHRILSEAFKELARQATESLKSSGDSNSS
jgi:Fic family protein